jgi:hypothetical protein
MPDEIVSIKDIYEKVIKVESKLDEVLSLLHGGIIKQEQAITLDDVSSPFYNPETKLFDMKYYKQNQEEADKKK